ncbi:phage tail domain-containing protein [Anaerolentibacter hominis]|uniref:phage tail domain-containing protein n=1 Tax=Anaerolentibacter hominis TaxID=3079009 RepID=UPI0031B8A10A
MIQAMDFTYDGISSESYHILLCKINEHNLVETLSAGSAVELTTAKPARARSWSYLGQQYTSPIEFDITIAKKDFSPISEAEQGLLNRWLIRTDGYKMFQFQSDEYADIAFFATATESTNVSINGHYGMTFHMVCNAPFAFKSKETEYVIPFDGNDTFLLYNTSDEVGDLDPWMEVKVEQDGDLEFTNALTGEKTLIRDCVRGEILSIDSQNRKLSSSTGRIVLNDFNFIWPKLAKTYQSEENLLSCSLPCTVTLRYREIRKVGVC